MPIKIENPFKNQKRKSTPNSKQGNPINNRFTKKPKWVISSAASQSIFIKIKKMYKLWFNLDTFT